MKIINADITKKFCEIKPGEIFQLSNGNVFLKTECCFDSCGGEGDEYNAVILKSGIFVYLSQDERVFPKPNAEIILKS